MRRLLQRLLVLLVLLSGIVYAGDYTWLRFRVTRNRDPYGVVRVETYYAVPNKNGKGEQYFFLSPQNQTCVHSLFPHFGYSPCWYLNDHRQRRINL